MEKVKLPKKVADAIGEFRKHYKSGCEYDLNLLKSEDWYGANAIIEFTKESRDNMTLYFQALVNGYEVEQTKEERIQALFQQAKVGEDSLDDHPQVSYWRGKQQGIRDTLMALEIQIEGVNS